LRASVREVLTRQPPAFADRIGPDTGKRIKYAAEQFRKFIEDDTEQGGLGTDIETLRRLLDTCEERALFELAIGRGPGAPAGKQNARKDEPEAWAEAEN